MHRTRNKRHVDIVELISLCDVGRKCVSRLRDRRVTMCVVRLVVRLVHAFHLQLVDSTNERRHYFLITAPMATEIVALVLA